jgi:transcriptional regulator with XRE-family HTH domain
MAGEKLREMIDERGLKQKFIAEKIGISETALSQMLNGKQKIDVDTFLAIATVMHMTPDEIYSFKKDA